MPPDDEQFRPLCARLRRYGHTVAEAQESACIDILSFLMSSAPQRVHMHPSNWTSAHAAIEDLRAAVKNVYDAYSAMSATPADGGSRLWQRLKEAWAQDDRPSDRPPQQDVPPHRARAGTSATAPSDPRIKEQQTLDALLSLMPGVRYNPAGPNNRLPPRVWTVLKDSLPKGGLLPFLQAHPALFSIHLLDGRNTKGKPLFAFEVLRSQPSPADPPADLQSTPERQRRSPKYKGKL